MSVSAVHLLMILKEVWWVSSSVCACQEAMIGDEMVDVYCMDECLFFFQPVDSSGAFAISVNSSFKCWCSDLCIKTGPHAWDSTLPACVAVVQGRQRPRDELRRMIIAFSRLPRHFDLEFVLVLDAIPVHEASSELHLEAAVTQSTGSRAWYSTEVRWYVAMPCVCPCTGLPPRFTPRLLRPKPREV